MLGVGAARHQEDVVVGAARLARIGPARRVVAWWPPRRRLAGSCMRDEHAAAVMHDRILHRHLEMPAHPGAGVTDRRAGLDRLSVALAGDAHSAARGLGDRVEREAVLIGASGAEAL